MGRAAGGQRGGGPRRRAPANKRRIVDITNDIPRQHRGLLRALEAFGGPDKLDRDAYVDARQSEGEEFDRTVLVERYWSVLQNHLAKLAELGLAEARRLGVANARSAGAKFSGLADLGVIARSDADRLAEMQAIRNLDQHQYPAQTQQLLDAVLDLHSLLPKYLKRYGAWFGRLPY